MTVRDTFADAKPLGSIAQSKSTIDYTATILTERDADDPPDVTDYGFGQPVLLPMGRTDTDEVAVGVIHGTQVIDPGMGGIGPTLGRDSATDQFRPSLVDEPTSLAGIALLGSATVPARRATASGSRDRTTRSRRTPSTTGRLSTSARTRRSAGSISSTATSRWRTTLA